MAAAVTWGALRELAGFRPARGCALSMYLDLDPSTAPTPADADSRLRSLLARAEKELAGRARHSHEEKLALGRDLDRVREWWDGEFQRDGVRGVAVFVAGGDGLWRVLPLPRAVPDDVHLGRRLRLTPLVELAADGDGTFVAVVDRERGRVFELRAERLEEVVDRSEEQPGQHDQGGWSQARFQRHLKKLVLEHLKAVGGEIDRRVRRARGPRLVVVAPEELRREIEGALSAEAREALVGWASAEAHASPAELLAAAQPYLAHARAAEVEGALERWREERGTSGRASAGWAETLDAVSAGRVELLLLADGAGQEAFGCPECGRVQAAAGACPLDGAGLEPDAATDLVVQQTIVRGGAVSAVPGGLPDDAEGVAALLRF